ncbi:MAG: non-ribosomal peptide synthetase, partial [Verrucomicrobia bacterium]|nr:non-ribosomal peptide synthetase [Verrucomicrobiota bacterium]
MESPIHEGVAIIGLSGRFPGAGSVSEFWANLIAARDCVSFFTDEELRSEGLDPEALRRAGDYVPARGILRDAEWFDAAFFGIQPREAEVMDPQQRVFLESAWQVLEDAGYASGRFAGAVGVFAGASSNTYFSHVLRARPDLLDLVGHDQATLGNDKDYLATRVAYKLGLRGPAISVNTACSSSLVAVTLAHQSLLTYQCDLAIAGGVSITTPQRSGYFFQEGSIHSPDGHTRAFDALAQCLQDAIDDGDTIYAVIKGVGVNNDGSQRAGFGAPGIEGQSEAIILAQEVAGATPDSIGYIEAHGTATPIGDPIEIAALTRAFRRATERKQFCAIGSLKTNIGHLDAAAGAAGLLKTALALHHKRIPASLHFSSPNPKLSLPDSPFFVNATLRDWASEQGVPRRAGVSSFGIGGTNAHVVLEEAPASEPGGVSRPSQILVLSAKTPEALESASQNLAAHLRAHPEANLADIAFTLQVGRAE